MLLDQCSTVARRFGIGVVVCALLTLAVDQAKSQPLSELFPERDKLSDLLPLAEKGDARAQFQLGTKYLRGRGVNKDPAEALRWLRAAGDQGFVKAQLYLGNYCADVASDDTSALEWFRRAAANLSDRDGVIGARKAGVIISRDASRAREAAAYFRRAAERGDPQAQVLLGTLYLDGSGLDRNFADGLKWIERAATERYVLPKYVLTFIFAEGFGTPPDVQEAAARLSGVRKVRTDAQASYFIATFYQRGFWAEKENRPILSWLFKHMGFDDEAIRRYFERRRIGSSYRWADEERAIAWYRKAAEAGDIGAEVNLGIIHFNPKGSNWDCAEGMKWTRKAADRGDPTAQFNLGYLFLQGPYQSVTTIGLAGENVAEGVRVETVEADGAASRAGLRAGDIITSLNGNALATYGIEELEGAVEQRPILKLLVKRGGEDAARSIDVVPGEFR